MKQMEDELTGRRHLTFVIQRLLLTNVFSEKCLTITKIYIQKKECFIFDYLSADEILRLRLILDNIPHFQQVKVFI
jgi:hypothetical protein